MIGRFSHALLRAVLLALICTSALAQTAAQAPADQKATVEDQAVADILKATAGEREISEAVARRAGPMLFEDGVLSVSERDLVRELLAATSGRTAITTASGETFDIPPLSRQARAFLSLVQPPNLATLWLRGPVQMKQMVDVTVLSPDTARQVSGYILQRLNVVWMESTLANGYEPMRRDLSAAIRMLQQTDADTERQGRSLIYDAARQLDVRNGDAIPNYLYDYLR
jgi:hypothetical protein